MTYRTDYLVLKEIHADLLRAHQMLTGEISSVLSRETSVHSWKDETDSSELLRLFLHWLPDLIRHKEAQFLREQARACESEDARRVLDNAANALDPFHIAPDSSGVPSWFRTRDLRIVPCRVAPDPSPDEQKAMIR